MWVPMIRAIRWKLAGILYCLVGCHLVTPPPSPLLLRKCLLTAENILSVAPTNSHIYESISLISLRWTPRYLKFSTCSNGFLLSCSSFIFLRGPLATFTAIIPIFICFNSSWRISNVYWRSLKLTLKNKVIYKCYGEFNWSEVSVAKMVLSYSSFSPCNYKPVWYLGCSLIPWSPLLKIGSFMTTSLSCIILFYLNIFINCNMISALLSPIYKKIGYLLLLQHLPHKSSILFSCYYYLFLLHMLVEHQTIFSFYFQFSHLGSLK